jgi:hypothetical protein
MLVPFMTARTFKYLVGLSVSRDFIAAVAVGLLWILFASGAVVSHSFDTFDLHTTCSFPTIVIQGILDLVASCRNKSYQPRVPPLQKGGPKSDSASVRRGVLARPRNLFFSWSKFICTLPYFTFARLFHPYPVTLIHSLDAAQHYTARVSSHLSDPDEADKTS